MTKRTGKRKDAALPAAACDQELYDRLTQYAGGVGQSRSEVIREAVDIFLRGKFRKSRHIEPEIESERAS